MQWPNREGGQTKRGGGVTLLCWSRFWRCKEGRAWWSEVVVLPGVEKKMGKGRLAEEKKKKTREEMIFCQLCTLISPLSGHEIHPYL